MVLYVVRHGETEINRLNLINGQNNPLLNETGIKQALEAGEKLKNIKFDEIISSPLIRALDTARNININNYKITLDNRLMEKDAGPYTEKPVSSINVKEWWKSPSKYDKEGVEPIDKFYKRVMEFLLDLIDNHQNDTILLTTHGGVAVCLESYFKNIPYTKLKEELMPGNAEIRIYNL